MNDQLATKQDLRDLEGRIDGKLDNLESRIDAKLDALKQEMMQFSRDLQTELLRGIEGLLRPGELRLRRAEGGLLTLQSSDGAMNERIAGLETRMFDVEKKLLLRPPEAGA